jgi:hypothetical protein
MLRLLYIETKPIQSKLPFLLTETYGTALSPCECLFLRAPPPAPEHIHVSRRTNRLVLQLINPVLHRLSTRAPPLVCILRQKNPVHILKSCFFQINFNIILHSVVKCSELLASDPEVRVRFLALSDFLRSSRSGTGSTQPREYD